MTDSFISNFDTDNDSDQEILNFGENSDTQNIENVDNGGGGGSGGGGGGGGNDEPFKKYSIPSKQPGDQFNDSLLIDYIGHVKLSTNDLPILRNNIVTSSKIWDILFIADRSHILVHEYNPITRKPESRPSLIMETRPSHTTVGMRAGANWTHDPHGINYLKIASLQGKEVLVSAGDDGRVLMWYTIEIQKNLRKRRKELIRWRWRLNSGEGGGAVGPDISHTNSSISLNSNSPVDDASPISSSSLDPLKPFLSLQNRKSSWGISVHSRKRLLAVSENSCTVNVYVLGPFLDGLVSSDEIEMISSPTLEHNIPDVDFIDVDNEKDGVCYVACVSISGQAVMWSFHYGGEEEEEEEGEEREEEGNDLDQVNDSEDNMEEREESGDGDQQYTIESIDEPNSPTQPLPDSPEPLPRPELHYQTSLEIIRIPDDTILSIDSNSVDESDDEPNHQTHFHNGTWWFEENLKQEGWSINSLYEDDFKAVSSLYDATGNKWLSEEPLFKSIMKENKKKLADFDNQEYDLFDYPAIRFITNDIETKFIQKLSHVSYTSASQDRYFDLPLCKNKDEKVSNYFNQHGKSIKNLQNPPFKNKFFLITTKKSLYLCQAEDLFCNAARSNVFSWESPYGSDEIYFDRLNIVEIIKPLSTVIVVSQIGAISIFRLTQYRGIFCMRQEYAFPDVEKLLFEGTRLRVLVGISISPIKTDGDKSLQPKYRLDVVYLDGLVLTFELSRKGNDEIFIENIVL